MSDFPKVLTKGKQRRTANTQADVVRFEFDGFKLSEPSKAAEPDKGKTKKSE